MRKFLATFLSCAMIVSLAACGAGDKGGQTADGSGSGAAQTTTGDASIAGDYDITVWVDEKIVSLTQEQIEAFNSSNTDGIKFNATIEKQGEGDAATNMITDVEAGADLFIFAQDQTARLIKAGALQKLGVAAGEMVRSTNHEFAVAAATSGSDLYAYPVSYDNGYFMYYDKSVIPESDIDSLEAILADCEKAGKYFAMETNTSAWYLASFFFGTGCVSEWTTDDDGNFVSVNDTFDSDKGLIAAKGLKKLLDSSANLSSSQASEFANGAAAVVSGTWAYTDVEAVLGDNMGAADLPSFNVDGSDYHMGSFKGCKLMGVKPQTDPAKAAALNKLAQYLTDADRQLERFNEVAWGPSNVEAAAKPEVLANKGLTALAAQDPYAVPQGQVHGSWWNIGKVIGDDVKAATDDAGLQAALDSYKGKIDQLFNLSGFIFVGAWNDWSNSDENFKLEQVSDETYTITLDVPQSDYMGGRIVVAGSWDTDKGCTIVEEGADLIAAPDPDSNGDNNIIFNEAGNYTVTFNTTGKISIVKN
ncbi:MAG: extracellular solute-binding protein [Lachnospiraceae bacterium]|nr:extracellular solute-binding protein [Lachnospiraceae bacterium]